MCMIGFLWVRKGGTRAWLIKPIRRFCTNLTFFPAIRSLYNCTRSCLFFVTSGSLTCTPVSGSLEPSPWTAPHPIFSLPYSAVSPSGSLGSIGMCGFARSQHSVSRIPVGPPCSDPTLQNWSSVSTYWALCWIRGIGESGHRGPSSGEGLGGSQIIESWITLAGYLI